MHFPQIFPIFAIFANFSPTCSHLSNVIFGNFLHNNLTKAIFFKILMNVRPAMEDAMFSKVALTLLAGVPVGVVQVDTQQTAMFAKVSKENEEENEGRREKV